MATTLMVDPKLLSEEYASLPTHPDVRGWPKPILKELSRNFCHPFGTSAANGATTPTVALMAPDSLSPIKDVVIDPEYVTMHGFIASIVKAWDDELPLALKPDHFWHLVLQAVAGHVVANAEELRPRFVAHDGQMVLRVHRDGWVGGPGTAGYDWAGVATELTAMIDANTVDGVVEMTATDFTTTAAADVIAGKMTVMSGLQKFFAYRVSTRCGYPSITLEGTPDDWVRLRDKVNALVGAKCLPSLSTAWLPALNSALDRFVTAVTTREVDAAFWQSMCKRGGTTGSGSRSWLNGWYNVFFPTNHDGSPNKHCVPYTLKQGYALEDPGGATYGRGDKIPAGAEGMEEHEMPNGMTTTPAIWEYLGANIPFRMRSGFVGITQRGDGTISPAVGWCITVERV